MVKLQWLQINRFRSVKPGTRLTFNSGYNVLLGQNGTGKTTLLNLVAAVVRSDFSEFRDVDFDLQYSLSSEVGIVTISVGNERKSPILQPAVDSGRPSSGSHMEVFGIDVSRAETVLTSEVRLESRTSRSAIIKTQGSAGTVQFVDGAIMHPAISFETGDSYALGSVVTVVLVNSQDKNHELFELISLFREFRLQRFDESLDYFKQLSGMDVEVVRLPDGVIGYSKRRGSRELHDALAALARDKWGEDRYVITHDLLPFLQKTIQLLNFESAEATIDLQESAHRKVGEWMKLSNLGFFFTHYGGWKISAKLLSYGQKRMLAFLYYLATVQSVAVADELVNGLHHRWIQAAIEALGQRQVFLTSQNPLLLDYLTFENPEQVRSTFILCRWEGAGSQARMLWENMTQEAAEDFFDSYKVGFQQVGELLQAKGLW